MRVNQNPVLIAGGPIHVMDETAARPEAFLLVDGRVAGVGTAGELAAQVGSGLQRIDLAGATALPGLIDTHPHLLHFAARKGSFVELGDAKSHAEIVERIRAKAQGTAPGKWIYCTPIGIPTITIAGLIAILPNDACPIAGCSTGRRASIRS